MSEQLKSRRQWHLQQIEIHSEAIQEHLHAAAEIDSLLSTPGLFQDYDPEQIAQAKALLEGSGHVIQTPQEGRDRG